MSVIKREYTSKKTGKTKRTYIACEWHPLLQKKVYGDSFTNRKNAKNDNVRLIKQIQKDIELEEVRKKQSSKLLFDTVADEWFRATNKSYSDETYKTYKSYYRRYIKGVFGDSEIDEIESSNILKFKECMENGTNDSGKEYSPETINKCINILCNIFNFAVSPLKSLEAKNNPMIGIKRNKVPYTVKQTWTDEQISLFLKSDQAKDSHYYAMFCCQLILGPRPSETCGLGESDYIPEQQTFTMHRTYNKYGVLEDHMKGKNSYRPVYLPGILNSIVRQKLLWKKEKQLEYPDLFDNDFLFTTEIGTPVRPNHLYRMFTRTIERYNKAHNQKLPEITLYECRHTFATTNYERGESEKVLSEIMGNTPATFLQKYAHIRGDKKRQSLDEFETVVFGATQEK